MTNAEFDPCMMAAKYGERQKEAEMNTEANRRVT